jgi:rubrerythrin
MEEKYTAKDILEMAVDAKAKGIGLYLSLAEASQNYHVGKLFLEWAKDEKKHKKELEKMLKKIKSAKEEAYPGEVSLFLKALADENAFHCDGVCARALKTTISEKEAFKACISFEKDFALFLHSLRSEVVEADRKVVDSLIEDEMQHMKEMFAISNNLAKK